MHVTRLIKQALMHQLLVGRHVPPGCPGEVIQVLCGRECACFGLLLRRVCREGTPPVVGGGGAGSGEVGCELVVWGSAGCFRARMFNVQF